MATCVPDLVGGSASDDVDLERAALDGITSGVVVFAADGRVRHANPEARRLGGERLAGKHVGDVLASGTSARFSVPAARADGTTATIRGTASPLRDHAGRLIGVVATLVEADGPPDALRALEVAVEGMVDGVFVVDRDLRFHFANRVGCAMHGLVPEEVLGRCVPDFPAPLRMRHPDGRPVTLDELPLARALRGEVVEHMDKIVFNAKTGRDVHFRVSAAPLREGGAIVGAVEVARDVTELVELETLKDDFVSVAAHELRTPIAIVKGYTAQLRRTLPELADDHRRMLDALDRGSDRLLRITEDLLELSYLHLGRHSVVVEHVALREVVERAVAEARKGGHPLRVLRLDDVDVRADPVRIGQVLARLLDNARRYSPDGGEVEIALIARDADAVVTVTDHGVGIPKDRQARVFERFHRAHAGTPHDLGGMGVGLYISRGLVRQMGGDITFTSEEGHGTTFSATLPRWTSAV